MAYIRYNYPIAPLTWLKVGGPVKTLFIPKNLEEIQEFLKTNEDPITILGAVSNSLILDGGINGTVIKTTGLNFINFIDEQILEVGSGTLDKVIAQFALDNSIGGLEFLDSIPGTIGGNILTNAGCYGSEIKDIVIEINAVDKQGNLLKINPQDFHFTYRNCQWPNNLLMIYSVIIKGFPSSYEIIKEKMMVMAATRSVTQPTSIATCGSTFKNPNHKKAWELIKESNGYLLKVNDVGWSHIHCNFLENHGKKANDIYQLIKNTQELILNTKGILLELEIFIFGNEVKSFEY